MTAAAWAAEPSTMDESAFPGHDLLQAWCDRIGEAGLRGTASAAHEDLIAWLEHELSTLPGVTTRSDAFDLLRWEPLPDNDLSRAGWLQDLSAPPEACSIPVGGAVPYSKPTEHEGELVYLPTDDPITGKNARGKVVLRDFPDLALPYALLTWGALATTDDITPLLGQSWDRGGLADEVLHQELLAAGRAGAAGLIFAFDFPRAQVAGYFDPHRGTHYRVPAVFVGVDERERLHHLATTGASVRVGVSAQVVAARTRNLIATLPGRSEERVVLVTHTDGNTWVQDNGVAAMLALATYFSAVPVEQRRRTLEFAFTSAHLHISREGSVRYAAQLDAQVDAGTVAFAFAVEHLGTRELVPLPRENGPGRHLAFTGDDEITMWATGPSALLREAVEDAVGRRGLTRTMLTPGFGSPVSGRVPEIVGFGGLGSYYHVNLIPTTAILSGPWSLWAPSFGRDAIDIQRLRQQVLAIGDVITTTDCLPREAIADGYLDYRSARTAGAPVGVEPVPPEVI